MRRRGSRRTIRFVRANFLRSASIGALLGLHLWFWLALAGAWIGFRGSPAALGDEREVVKKDPSCTFHGHGAY